MADKIRRIAVLIGCLWSIAACGQVLQPATLTPLPTAGLEAVELITAMPEPTRTVLPRPTDIPATPLPTATPIIHVVQAGDTLLGIALRNGVSVQDLQLANPALRPELLQIGQQILIPIDAAAADALAEQLALVAVPTPVPLEIVGLGTYETPVGGLLCLGEVRNPGQAAVENVQVAVELFDPNGTLVDRATAWVARDVIPSGETAAFGILFPDAPPSIGTERAETQSAEPVSREGYWSQDLVIQDDQGGPAGAVYRVTGSVLNRGAMPAEEIMVLVTLLAEDGRVTGFRQRRLEGVLNPGDVVSFDLWLSPAGSGTARYVVAVNGRQSNG